ncbi:MAG TPA: hypothetical protein VJV75_13370 [Candidatus Polarisedimenticolia bacterium]|nr:hypothetical protein [Candidatus Polarisedimenticolia bacterium]
MGVTKAKRATLANLIRRAGMIDDKKPWIVAPAVMFALKRYDPQLFIYWDLQGERYCIARRGENSGQLHFIAIWQDDDGAYLPLDNRILDAIRAWDMRPPTLDAPKSADELAGRMDAQDDKAAAKDEADFKDDMDHLTRANRPQLNKAIEEAH